MRLSLLSLLLGIAASSASCVFVAGDVDPLILGVGAARVTTAQEPVPGKEGLYYVARDSNISTPLLLVGYSRPLSGIVLGPSKVRVTSIHALPSPVHPTPGPQTCQMLPFLFHLPAGDYSPGRELTTRDWVGSIGVKAIRQSGALTFGIGYQSRMIASGIAEDFSWGYALYEEEPWVRIITAETTMETLKEGSP